MGGPDPKEFTGTWERQTCARIYPDTHETCSEEVDVGEHGGQFVLQTLREGFLEEGAGEPGLEEWLDILRFQKGWARGLQQKKLLLRSIVRRPGVS